MSITGFMQEMQARLDHTGRDRTARCANCSTWLDGPNDVLEVPDDPRDDTVHRVDGGKCGPVIIVSRVRHRCEACGSEVEFRDVIDDGGGKLSHKCGPVVATAVIHTPS